MAFFDRFKRKAKSRPDEGDWQEGWDDRLAVLESQFGKASDSIATSPVPLYLGGGADVLAFGDHIDGLLYVTAGLIGSDDQRPTQFGEYELAMCVREHADWAMSLMSKLAPYTFEAALKPGETMDIAPAMPDGSTIAALLFQEHAKFEFRGSNAGVILCVGITASELDACRNGEGAAVVAGLQDSDVYPFTDVGRGSVV